MRDSWLSPLFYIVAILLTLGVTAVAFFEDCYPLMVFIAVLCFFSLIKIAVGHVQVARVRATERVLTNLKNTLRMLVKEFKKDNNFVQAKSFIEKYDEEEKKESFFSHVQKRRRDPIEKIADYVLANDPSTMNALICKKCGLHNGLIDPANKDVRFFYCYSCKERNIRQIDAK